MGILRLAWTEFARAFRPRFAPGGRDLMWFTLLLAGLQLHGLVILAAREGILEQSVNAFLGYEEGYGVPVWVLPNSLRSSFAGAIDKDLIETVNEGGFGMEPYRRYRASGKLRLPAAGIWKGGQAMAARSLPRFAGLAVDPSGPLWPDAAPAATAAAATAAAEPGPEWPIVLNASTFERFFDLATYRAALRGRIPDDAFAEIPERIEDITQMPRIWLVTRVHRGTLTPFRVAWAPHITIGAEQIAFVAPLGLWHMMDEAARNPAQLCLFVEAGPVPGRRLLTLRSKLLPPGTDRAEIEAGFRQLAERLGGEVAARPTRIQITFGTDDERAAFRPGQRCDPGLPEALVRGHAAALGLPIDERNPGEHVVSAGPVGLTRDSIELPCEAVADDRRAQGETHEEGGACRVRLPISNRATGFEEAFVYATSRLEIGRLLDFVLCRPAAGLPAPADRQPLCRDPEVDPPDAEPESRLRIDEVYEDALTRYNFLTDLIEQLRGPIGIGLFVLLFVILWVQIGTILGHRRLRYAMLLCNGATWGQIRLMLVLQALLAVALALAMALSVFLVVHSVLDAMTAGFAERYPVVAAGIDLNPLPVSAQAILSIAGLAILTSISLLLLQARWFGISRRLPVEALLR